MKRRVFLGFLGGAAVAGPAAAKTAAQMTASDLSIGRVAGLASGMGNATTGSVAPGGYNQTSWAKDALKRLSGVSKIEKEMRKQRYYGGNELDANIASLRSMSLVNRIRVSRDIQFERSEAKEKTYLEGIIAGWWS